MTGARLRWGPSAQGLCLLALAAVSTGAALLTRRADLLALGVPALWSLLTPTRGSEPERVRVDSGADHLGLTEGGSGELTVAVALDLPVEHLTGRLVVPRTFTGTVEGTAVDASRLVLTGELTAERWGRHALGPVRLDLLSTSGLRSASADVPLDLTCVVVPQPESIGSASAPRVLPNRLGEHVTRTPGHGTEPIGVRPFASGDPIRRVNWRVSSRRQQLHVTVAAAERAVDLVVVIDALSDVGVPPDTSLDRAVRLASGLATRYLRERDRVGLVVLGGALRWVTPASSGVQQQRIAEALLWAWSPPGDVPPDVDRVPRTTIPPGSVVVVLTPLLQERTLAALASLRHRSAHVLVVDVLGSARPPVGRKDVTGQLAARLWELERAATVERLRRLGTPVLQPRAGELDRLITMALRSSR